MHSFSGIIRVGDRQQPDTTLWWNEHTRLYEEGYMQGIEVANGKKYSPEAQRWCMEKKLTMIGTSDIHQPIRQISILHGANTVR